MASYPIFFCAAASPDPDVQEASRQARNLLENAFVEVSQNEAMFQRISAVIKKREHLDIEDGRFLQRIHNQFVRNGMLLSSEDRESLHKIRSSINEKSSMFHANLRASSEFTWVSKTDMHGVPDHILAKFEEGSKENTGKLRVTLDTASVGAIMRFAKSDRARQQVFLAHENRCHENDHLFHNVVQLRDQAARLLGFASHASLQLVDKMAGTPEVVESFLRDLQTNLAGPSKQEAHQLLQLKKTDTTAFNEMNNDYYLWDYSYYHRLSLEQVHQVDHQQLSEYFPLEVVLERMLLVFERLFELKFQEGTHNQAENFASTYQNPSLAPWHKDVRYFSVWDTNDRGSFLGHLYMDLYSRHNKDSGPANHTIIPGFTRADGTRQCPSSALLCSFPRPSPTDPSLLRHDEVCTLFHELGHGIHDMVSKTAYACFHGTAVPVDFGEAPSQMLEYWCWSPTTIKSLSKHYSTMSKEYEDLWRKQTGSTEAAIALPPEQIPDDMVSRLINTKHINSAHFYLNQLRLGLFDMVVHNPPDHQTIDQMNMSATFNMIRSEVYPPRGPERLGQEYLWGTGHTLCGHLMSEDYSAGYYSYLFSKVFAADMFYTVFMSDPMSAVEGNRYRYTVLEKGGSRDAMEMMTEFLGRAPNSEAFERELSLAS